MHHGITVMLKNSLILIVLVAIVISVTLIYKTEGNGYWESIGPSWDRMFNPNKYEQQSE